MKRPAEAACVVDQPQYPGLDLVTLCLRSD
jgi:hypothetical protein